MPNEPQSGENTVVLWEPDGAGSPITLSEYGRNAEPSEEADVYDSTTYAEAQLGYRTYVPGLGDGTFSMEIMYQVGDSATYNALAPRTKGELTLQSEGTGATKPQEVWTAIITSRSKPHPYDDLMVMAVEWQLSGAPDRTAQA
mgnify:CR=1 FL=1